MVVGRKKRRTMKRKRATAGAGMQWGLLGRWLGPAESTPAGGDCTDVAAALGRRVSWETLNLICPCPFLLFVSQLPFVLSCHSFWQTNEESLFFTACRAFSSRALLQMISLCISHMPRLIQSFKLPSWCYHHTHTRVTQRMACLYKPHVTVAKRSVQINLFYLITYR